MNTSKQLHSELLAFPTLATLKKAWLEAKHQEIYDSASAGCGLVYELFEARFQSAIEHFLDRNRATLTKDDIAFFKDISGYQENFKPYTEVDEETGQTLGPLAIAKKLVNGGSLA